MKLYTILLSILLSTMVYAEEVQSVFYVYESTINEYKAGKTIDIQQNKQVEISTKSNESIHIILPNKVSIKLESDSTFVINNATIDIDDINVPPQTLKSKSSIYVFSLLNGTADLIVDNSSPVRIYTPRVNLIVQNGCYRINVQGKTTAVMNLIGKITATGLVKQKGQDIPQSQLGLITTYVPIVNTENVVDKNKPILSTSNIEDDDLKMLKNNFDSLIGKNKSIFFTLINKSIIGIKVLD